MALRGIDLMNNRRFSFSKTEFFMEGGFEDNSETDLLEFKKASQLK